jgi:hypothetical protein
MRTIHPVDLREAQFRLRYDTNPRSFLDDLRKMEDHLKPVREFSRHLTAGILLSGSEDLIVQLMREKQRALACDLEDILTALDLDTFLLKETGRDTYLNRSELAMRATSLGALAHSRAVLF